MPTAKKISKSATKRSGSIDLARLFSSVVTNLQKNQTQLNRADSYNHDHGDNMVEIFKAITGAVKDKSGTNPSQQLAYASQILKQSKSGSAQLYAAGLTQAAKEFRNRAINPDTVGLLLQTLLGGGQVSTSPTQASSLSGDLMGALLGGSSSGQKKDTGLDVGDLLTAGAAFMDAKQRGSSNVEALVGALVSASPMGQTEHRAQSGTLVANTILQVLGSLTKK